VYHQNTGKSGEDRSAVEYGVEHLLPAVGSIEMGGKVKGEAAKGNGLKTW